jgi:hypothetical protein
MEMNVHLILSFADIIATGSISALAAAAAPLIPLQSLSARRVSLFARELLQYLAQEFLSRNAIALFVCHCE